MALAMAGPSIGAAIHRRAPNVTDVDILNFALTLEHLESKFYRDGLLQFKEGDFATAGYDAAFYDNLVEISADEDTHVSFLTTALTNIGAPAVAECTYNFGVTSVETFLAIASVLEGVGVSAYLGAAASISTGAYLTAAGSILTVEARHNAYLRANLNEAPFAQPFDAPLAAEEVLTLAAPFIVECPPGNAAITPLTTFPALAATGPATISTGSTITLTAQQVLARRSGPYSTRGSRGSKGRGGHRGPHTPHTPHTPHNPNTPNTPPQETDLYAAWAAVTGSIFTDITSNGDGSYTTVVPAGIHGQSYVAITDGDSDDSKILAGPALVEVSGTTGSP